MKARPPKTQEDIFKLLPKHLHPGHGGQDDTTFPDGSAAQFHAQIPELRSNAKGSTTRPNAEGQNRQLNADIAQALTNNKPLEAGDNLIPRFVIAWRIFPNPLNPIVHSGGPDACGCGCSCGG
jgi:hypothetical protein